MAVANTFRRKGRLALSLLVLVTAGSMFLMVMSLSTSITATLDAEFHRRTYDIVVFDQQQRIDEACVWPRADGVAKATMWYGQPVTILFDGQKANEAGLGTEIVGVPLDDPMYMPPMVAGRWLQHGDRQALSSARTPPTTTTSRWAIRSPSTWAQPARASGRWSGCTRSSSAATSATT